MDDAPKLAAVKGVDFLGAKEADVVHWVVRYGELFSAAPPSKVTVRRLEGVSDVLHQAVSVKSLDLVAPLNCSDPC